MILLFGDILVNEASLTGESLPIPKQPLKENFLVSGTFIYKKNKNNILYEGTTVMRIKEHSEGLVLGLALRTGYLSYKG
jgi:magnesium-transporting ATPase (P-type)